MSLSFRDAAVMSDGSNFMDLVTALSCDCVCWAALLAALRAAESFVVSPPILIVRPR